MLRKVEYNGKIIEYNLEYKKVKNINLRVKPDLSIQVSANKKVSSSYIDNFVISKGEFILSAIDKITNNTTTELKPKYNEKDFNNYILDTFISVCELFSDKIKCKPILKMRKMTSCWGTCNYQKGIITLNKNLIYCTKEQIYYVVVHEFAHLLVHNHSKEFYDIVELYCKNYKEIIKEMKNIYLKRG